MKSIENVLNQVLEEIWIPPPGPCSLYSGRIEAQRRGRGLMEGQ